MSGPATALPPEIAELMAIEVTYETFTGYDGAAQPSYDPPKTLSCWMEEFGFTSGGLLTTRRGAETIVGPRYSLYFDGDSADAQEFSPYDRFTLPAVGLTDKPGQPDMINEIRGPNFDNQNPWLIEVMFS